MEQKLELLEKEQQKLRQEVESLHEIINTLQTQIDYNCDIDEISSVSDEYDISDESLISKIENVIESKLESFKDFIIKTIKDNNINDRNQ